MRRRREKKRAKTTVSDVKTMENIAKFTKKCIKKSRRRRENFWGFGQISKKPPLLFGISATGGGLLLTIPLMSPSPRVDLCKTDLRSGSSRSMPIMFSDPIYSNNYANYVIRSDYDLQYHVEIVSVIIMLQ